MGNWLQPAGFLASLLTIMGAGTIVDFGTITSTEDVTLAGQLANLATLALLVERLVEIYLGLTHKNGAERVPLATEKAEEGNAKFQASLVSFILGLLIAASGVRILPYMDIDWATGSAFLTSMQTAVDIALTAGIIAGGSQVAHEVVEAVKGGFRKASLDQR